MIALATDERTYSIQGYNVCFNPKDGMYEFWITKMDGKTQSLVKGAKDVIEKLKEDVDKAVEEGAYLFRIK